MITEKLDALIREYADSFFQHSPVMASVLGVHDYDGELGDFSKEALEDKARRLKDMKRRTAELLGQGGLEGTDLPLDKSIDAELLVNRIDLDLLELEGMRIPNVMPSMYADNCLYGVFILTARDFAPMDERIPNILSRLEQIPGLLSTAKENLHEPPEVFTKVAMEVAAGGAAFMDETAAIVALASQGRAAKVQEAAAVAKEAFRDYVRFLEDDLLPRSKGSFAIGEDLYNERLRIEHMLKKTAQDIGLFGSRLLDGTRREMSDLASRIRDGAQWREIISEAKTKHPEAGEIKSAYVKEMGRARRFVEENDLVTIPPDEVLRVVDTPVFERPIIPYAAYLAPGAFERKQEGLFYVTPVDPGASPEQIEDQLQGHNYSSLAITALHEAYPGHHLQLVRSNKNPSIIRKLIESNLFAEGWALYCEEMMYRQGFYPDDVARLYQMKDGLWRAARVVIDVGLHTGEMSFDEGVEFLVDKAMIERTNAIAEVKRYTMMPTQPMSYSVGKMEIVDLLGAARSLKNDLKLKEFHDLLLDSGTVPPAAVRKELLAKLAPAPVR
jgi:uncharacterized protein (DUF885 family)